MKGIGLVRVRFFIVYGLGLVLLKLSMYCIVLYLVLNRFQNHFCLTPNLSNAQQLRWNSGLGNNG